MIRPFLPVLIAAAAGLPGAALAQNGNAAQFNAGYSRSAGDENRVAAQSTLRDANGNLVVVDGVIKTANGQPASFTSNTSGVGSNSSALGAQSVSGAGYGTGVGSAAAVAIGNQLNVVTTGSYNTVVINSAQTNNGAVSAGAIGNGGVSNAH